MDFSSLIEESTQDFTGREWVFSEIDRWLADPDTPRYFIITGEPGIGKTAIATRLTQIRDLDAHHFCIARQADTVDPLLFAGSLSEQLAHIDGFALGILKDSGVHIEAQQNVGEVRGHAINVQIKKLVIDASSATVAFSRIVLDPLQVLYADGFDRQVVILVDALDEAVRLHGTETIVDLLASARGLPPRVRFVLTSRPEGSALRHFEWLNIPYLVLDAGQSQNQQDVRAYIRYRLETSEVLQRRLAEQKVAPQAFVERVTKASGGNFLYLVWLLRAITEGTQRPDALEALPQGLDGVYREFLRTRAAGEDITRWRERYRPLLGTLATAGEPLTARQLVYFTSLSLQAVKDALLDVQQFFDPCLVEKSRYQLYHHSVADFLGSEDPAQEFWIDVAPIHQQIADYYLNTYGDSWISCDDAYCLQNLAKHLVGADRSKDLCLLVQDPGWYSSRSRQDFSRQGYVSDLDLAFNAISHQGSWGWPHLAANSLIAATLAKVSRYLPVEVYETLVRIGKAEEALLRARMIPDVPKRDQVLTRIVRAVRESDGDKHLEKIAEGLIGHSETYESHQPQSEEDDWLVGLVARWGAERALRQLLQTRMKPVPDSSVTVQHYVRVSRAAFSVGQAGEARRLLLECLELVNGTWDWDRQGFLIEIASLLLQAGYEDDLFRVIDLASGIDLEQVRTFALAELALTCSDASSGALKGYSLETAVSQVKDIEQRSNLQHVLSKIALAMSKIGDDRAGVFVREAIQLAEKPTQPAWYWQEQAAWMRIAYSLVSMGLCDETLDLIKRLDLERRGMDRIAVELALQGRWDDAWNLAQDLHPILRRRALFALAKQLDSQSDRYDAIVAEIENDLEQGGRPQAQAEALDQLIDLSKSVQDEAAARGYLHRLVNVLDDVPGQLGVDLLIRAARRAVELSDTESLQQLADRAKALSEDAHDNRSTAMTAVCRALADLGEITHAWALAQDITDDGKRLEAYVRICESARPHGQAIDKYFDEALAFARRVDNAGWIPTHWGALALLAHQLGHSAKQECVDRAARGVLGPASHVAFRAYNSANVAEYLHQVGLSVQALELLEYGLTCVDRVDAGFGIDPLGRLVQVLVRTKTTALWPRVLQLAQSIEEPVLKANALLGVVHAIAYLGDRDGVVDSLPLVLAAIQDADKNEDAIIEFGVMLNELRQSDSEVLDSLITSVFEQARVENRSTVLTWTASLLPVFAKVDSSLAIAIWHRIKQVEAIFEQ